VCSIATLVDDFIDRIMGRSASEREPEGDEAFLQRDLRLYAVGGCHGNATNDHFVAESTHNAAFSAVLVA
jgi:hypothetical protein